MQLYAGTSGWSYSQWKQVFYPPGVKAGSMLALYARHFPAVELNSSFYRTPQGNTIERWRREVSAGFRFAVKAFQGITHEKRLRGCEALVEETLARYRVFGETLGPVLFQLPPSLVCDIGLLRDFLALLPHDMTFSFEFRHASWQREEVHALLAERGIALCLAHVKAWRTPLLLTAPFAYIRLHGSDAWFRGNYSEAFLDELLEWLDKQTAREAWIFCNNTITGADAPGNAAYLNAAARRLPS